MFPEAASSAVEAVSWLLFIIGPYSPCVNSFTPVLPHYPSSHMSVWGLLNLHCKLQDWSARLSKLFSALSKRRHRSVHMRSLTVGNMGGIFSPVHCCDINPTANFSFPTTFSAAVVVFPAGFQLVFVWGLHRSAGWPLAFAMLMLACREERTCVLTESTFPEALKPLQQYSPADLHLEGLVGKFIWFCAALESPRRTERSCPWCAVLWKCWSLKKTLEIKRQKIHIS